VPALNVTDRYTNRDEKLPEGQVRVMFRVLQANGERLSCEISIQDDDGASEFQGKTNDERFDANNHTTVALASGKKFQLLVKHDGQQRTVEFSAERDGQLVTVNW
jgi:hypothetical protein